MIRQVDLAWVALGVVDERHERPSGDPRLRVDRIRRELAEEARIAARAAERQGNGGVAGALKPALRPARTTAY